MPPAGKTWITVDTDLVLKPELGDLAASEYGIAEAGWLYLKLIAYSREKLTDGYIPKAVAVALAVGIGEPGVNPERRLDDLRMTTLLNADRHGYRIPSYTSWQQSRETVNAATEQRRAAGLASAARRTTRSTTRPSVRSTEESKSKNPSVGSPNDPLDRGRESTVPESTNGHQLDYGISSILDASITDQLTPAQVDLVNLAWSTSSVELRQSLADVEKAAKPVAMLVTVASRIAPSLDNVDQVDRRARAVARCQQLYLDATQDGDDPGVTIDWLANEYRHDPSIVSEAISTISSEPGLDADDTPI